MSHYYSKVDADSLLSLVNASDCVEYFGTSSLVSEMDETLHDIFIAHMKGVVKI